MLVLSRKKNESIVIDDKITIVIVDIRGDKVRLGIEAPKDVSVHRQEIFEAIQEAELEDPSAEAVKTNKKKPAVKKEKPAISKDIKETSSTDRPSSKRSPKKGCSLD